MFGGNIFTRFISSACVGVPSMSAFNESLLHYYLIGHRGRPKLGPPTQSKPRELGLKARTTCFVPTPAGIPAILAEETRFFSARMAP